jgi:hypothetical protein
LDQKRNADAVSAQIGTSNGVQAPAARVAAGKQAPTAPTAPAPPWQDHIVAALRANYPELFVRPADAGSVHIVMILYANGSVYRSARQQASTAAPAALAAAGGAPTETDATAQISQSLGVQAAELAVPAQTVVLNAAAGVPGSVTVVFGVLTAEASAAHTTPR